MNSLALLYTEHRTLILIYHKNNLLKFFTCNNHVRTVFCFVSYIHCWLTTMDVSLNKYAYGSLRLNNEIIQSNTTAPITDISKVPNIPPVVIPNSP